MSQNEPYEPQEDSLLLKKHIKEYASGKAVLDMGTGSGVQAIEASKYVDSVLAVDINPEALKEAKKLADEQGIKNIKFRKSNLFSNIKKNEAFDIILFNPPYLPAYPDNPDLALDGGKYGYEILSRFLDQVNPYLKREGVILIVFSKLTKPDKVKEFVFRNCLKYEQIDTATVFFEPLYVWKIEKSDILKKLEGLGMKKVSFFTRGKRGYLYRASWKSKDVVIKSKNPSSQAVGNLENEVKFLKLLEKCRIAPKLLFACKDFFVYGYIEGVFIFPFVETHGKKDIINLLKIIFQQMRTLDRLGINKEEMHYPYKHIIINKKGKLLDVKLVDFERAHKTENLKNVTQFCQFLISNKFNAMLADKNIIIEKQDLIKLSQKYKQEMDDENFEKIVDAVR